MIADPHHLAYGPYRPPSLRRGDRTHCLDRDCEVVITSWTDAPISWPRCRRLDTRSAPSLLVDEELARAVRMESANAVMYWWGVSVSPIWKWRRALGVTSQNNPSSWRLRWEASKAGARSLKLHGLPDHVCDAMSKRARRLNLIRFARRNPARPYWTAEELAILASEVDDAEVAVLTGRTENAVRVMRWRTTLNGSHK